MLVNYKAGKLLNKKKPTKKKKQNPTKFLTIR